MPSESTLEQPLSNALLNIVYSFPQSFDDRLPLQCFNSQGVCLGGHNNERNHGGLRAGDLETVVQPSERLDEHIHTLIAVLITPGSEEVECVFQIEIVVAIEMSSDEVVDLLLGLGVEVLEFVHSRKLNDVEAIGKNTIWFSLEQMLTFVCRNMRYSSEDIARVGCCTFNTVTVVDSSLACFSIDVKVL